MFLLYFNLKLSGGGRTALLMSNELRSAFDEFIRLFERDQNLVFQVSAPH